jgi:hypothetical protein
MENSEKKTHRTINLPSLAGSSSNTYINPPLSRRYNNLKSKLNS